MGVALAPQAATRLHALPGLVFIIVTDVSPSTVAIAHRCGQTSPLVDEFLTVARDVARAEAIHRRDPGLKPAGNRLVVSRDLELDLAPDDGTVLGRQ
jgi:hypothetical protein